MLIQQRQPFKSPWPNMWDITVGERCYGWYKPSGYGKELLEEIGLEVNLHDTRPHLTINFDHGFKDVYLINMDIKALVN